MTTQRMRWAIAVAVASLAVGACSGAGSEQKASGSGGGATTSTLVLDQVPQKDDPFADPHVFCRPVKAPAGERNSSSPGVTADAIVIGDQSLDAAALSKLGVKTADYPRLTKVFVDEINKCGGINGRKLVLKQALYDVTAQDQQAELQSICVKLAEDDKAFIVTGVTSALIQRCLSVLHHTITDAPNGVSAKDFEDAEGRVISLYPAGDQVARVALLDGIDEGVFKGKRVGIVGPILNGSSVVEHRAQFVDVLSKNGVDAQLEMLPCTGNDCTGQMGGAVGRMKARGVQVIVLSNYFPPANVGAFLREMQTQGLRAELFGPYAATVNADSSMGAVTAAAGADGLKFAQEQGWHTVGSILTGQWRSGELQETPSGRMCQRTVADATGEPPVAFDADGIANKSYYAITYLCQSVRAIARAIYSLGNEVTTERMVAAMRGLKATERADSVDYPNSNMWYTKGRSAPAYVTTHELHFPCPVPTVDEKRGCFMPSDSPVQWRKVG